MSECHSSDHPVSVVVIVTVNLFTFSTSLKLLHTEPGLYLLSLLKKGTILILLGMMGNFVHFLPILKSLLKNH